ncbi:MAG: tRNA-binding protein [Chlamydiota bacterium]
MKKGIKDTAFKEETFDLLDIRIGKVIRVEEEPQAPKKAYKLEIDFGKFGVKTSVGRFTQHTPDEMLNQSVLAILNFEPRQIGNTVSEVLVLGVQYPKADSGEATIISPIAPAKIGGKVF